jgi:hypothetical protein
MHPINNLLGHEEPYIVSNLPGNIILKIDVDKLLDGTRAG